MLDFLILGTLVLGLLALAANVMTAPHREREASPVRTRAGEARPDAAGSPRGVPAVAGGAPARLPFAEAGRVRRTEEEWRAALTPEQYRILRGGATERPFTGRFWDHREAGVYVCAACGRDVFTSTAKYDSGSGWPSYHGPADAGAVTEVKDISYGMVRTEVVCGRCESHLGHVFPDGPRPTGRRYCINSAALDFRPATATRDAAAPIAEIRAAGS